MKLLDFAKILLAATACAALPARAQPMATTPQERFIAGAPIIDAASILAAARIDMHLAKAGKSHCTNDQPTSQANAASAAAAPRGVSQAPAGDAEADSKRRPGRLLEGLAALAGKRKPEAAAVEPPPPPAKPAAPQADPYGIARSNTDPGPERPRGCAVVDGVTVTPGMGLQVYAKIHYSPGLVQSATRATGVDESGAAIPETRKSRSCVWSQSMGDDSSIVWTRFMGITTPVVPTLDGTPERSISVVDVECLSRRGGELPANARVLSVHQYLDQVIEARALRAKSAGYAAYATRFLAEHAELKANRVR